MTAAERLAACAERLSSELRPLPDKPEETPGATLSALLHLAAGTALSAEAAAERPPPALDDATLGKLEGLVAQRLAGVPLAHLTGRQRFMGLELEVGKEALIPRRETELLGYAALELLRERAREQDHPLVIDLCTGSGNLALAMAHHVPVARVLASDLSAEAVELARRNAAHTGLQDRVEFRQGDLLQPFDDAAFHEKVDLLICNPPYISSARVGTMSAEIAGFEPRLAFDGGPFGIGFILRLLREAPRYLRENGWLAFEIGVGQGPGVMRRVEQLGAYREARSVTDAQGEIRVVLAQR